MKRPITPLVLVLLVLVGIWTWTGPVRVQESHGTRWEYCSVGLGFAAEKDRSISSVSYFAVGTTARTDAVDGKDPWDSFRRAIAKLGADGWEMTGLAGNPPVAYFKRAMP